MVQITKHRLNIFEDILNYKAEKITNKPPFNHKINLI